MSLLKGEGPAVVIRRLIEETQGVFRVLNGRGGLELPDNLRAGCVGMIPAPECFDVQVRIFELMQSGQAADEAEAERSLPRHPAAARLPHAVDRELPLLREAAHRAPARARRGARPPAGPAAHRVRARGRPSATPRTCGSYGAPVSWRQPRLRRAVAARGAERAALRSRGARCPRACSPPGTGPRGRSRTARCP